MGNAISTSLGLLAIMAPEFIYIRCPHCGRVYRTTVGTSPDSLGVLMPVLKLIGATCPDCAQVSMIGESEIQSPVGHAY